MKSTESQKKRNENDEKGKKHELQQRKIKNARIARKYVEYGREGEAKKNGERKNIHNK
jgi:hypothetical protein